jgi:glycosyltransferase involved in cell wall biosynthesis
MDVVNRYRDKIDIIIHEKDNGQTDAINKGFHLAKGELVGWINSDDILYPECLENIVNLYLKKRDGAIYYSASYDSIDVDGNNICLYHKIIRDRNYLLNINYDVVQQGSFYKTEIVRKINYLDITKQYCMDLDLWLRLLEHGNIYCLDGKPISAFRTWAGAKTTRGIRNFLCEIRATLLKHNASYLSPNIRRTYWYEFKHIIKQWFV